MSIRALWPPPRIRAQAHLRIRDHDKEFYRLCQYMEPAYYQLEFDARVWLLWRDAEEGRQVG